MPNKIRKVIKNKLNVADQAANGVHLFPTEEVLGSMAVVKDFAAFWVKHKEDILTAHATFLLDYCDTQSFTPEKLEAYRAGMEMIVKLFENADLDTNNYIAQAEEKKKGSVG